MDYRAFENRRVRVQQRNQNDTGPDSLLRWYEWMHEGTYVGQTGGTTTEPEALLLVDDQQKLHTIPVSQVVDVTEV